MRILWMILAALCLPSLVAAQTAPYPAAPLCASHNDRAFHTLWNAAQGCHYDHHHGDDPTAVNDLFGESLFALMGGEISHPWQTFSAAGYENDLKHAGYFWHVRRDLPCVTTGCITAFRLLVHQHPSGRDATVRFHSAVMEARVYDAVTGQSGSIQVPGTWVDFGDLKVNGVTTINEPLGTNGMETEPGRHKQHGAIPSPGRIAAPQLIWYGSTQATHTPDRQGRIPRGLLDVSTSIHDAWDFTEVATPGEFTDYACPAMFGAFGQSVSPTDPRCGLANATNLRPHLITVRGQMAQVDGNRAILDPDGDGWITGSFWFDRYGVPQQSGVCASASLDCVPVTITNISTARNYVCDQVCGQSSNRREYDVMNGNRSMGWSAPRP